METLIGFIAFIMFITGMWFLFKPSRSKTFEEELKKWERKIDEAMEECRYHDKDQ